MRPREEIEERLRVLTQALYFSHVHRKELSEEAQIRQRILEENIRLLQWCLSESETHRVRWGTVREAFHFFRHTLWQRLKPEKNRSSNSDAARAKG